MTDPGSDQREKPVIHINRTHIDWLSLSSWSPEFLYWHASRVDTGTPAKFRGYTALLSEMPNGTRWAGAGDQGGRTHYRMESTGYQAQLTADQVRQTMQRTGMDCYATRLDIARTVETPIPDTDLGAPWFRLIHDQVDGAQPSLVQSVTGLTLYIGSVTSDKRIRIYVKDTTPGGYLLLRFEVQYRRDLAKRLWRDYAQRGPVILDGMLNSELDKRGDLGRCVDWWRPADGIRHRTRPFEKPDTRRTWFDETLMPWIEKTGNDHDLGPLVRQRVRSLVRIWDKQERDQAAADRGQDLLENDLMDQDGQ